MSDSLSDSAAAERLAVQRQFRIVAAVAVLALLTGTVFYHFVEDLDWIDALYFCTITLTTVGYGDIVPHTDLGKIFTIFYVLAGIGIIATFANLWLKNVVSRREYRNQNNKKSK